MACGEKPVGGPLVILRCWRLGAIAATLGLMSSCAAWLRAADVVPRLLLLDGAVTGSDVIVVGERGNILRSGDRGRSWQAAVLSVRAPLTAISFAPGEPGTSAWAVGHDAMILVSHDAGRTWSVQFQGANLQESFLDVLALDSRHIIAVGADALYVESRDGGTTWTRRKIGEADRHFNRLTRGPAGTLYLAGERGTLLRSTDNGANWIQLTLPYEGSLYGVLPLDKRTLLAYGLSDRIYRSVDDGATWQPIKTPKSVLLATAVQLRGGIIVLAGTAGTLLVSRDGGKSFSPLMESPTKGIARLLEVPGGDLLALGESGATLLPRPQ